MNKRTIEEALAEVPDEHKKEALFLLNTPDMCPARNIAEYLKVSVPAVHTWRRERGLKKARS